VRRGSGELEMASADHSHRARQRGAVERLRRGRPPVEQRRLLLVGVVGSAQPDPTRRRAAGRRARPADRSRARRGPRGAARPALTSGGPRRRAPNARTARHRCAPTGRRWTFRTPRPAPRRGGGAAPGRVGSRRPARQPRGGIPQDPHP
jgi:hypothetical protein